MIACVLSNIVRRTFLASKVSIHSSATVLSQQLVTFSEENGVRRLVLNNPQKRNPLSYAVLETLHSYLAKESEDKKLRCIVISSNGPVFSAGHDLKELRSETGEDYHEQVFNMCSQVMLTIRKLPVPVIAEIRGLAAAAGCQLAASCDIVVASENSHFSTPGASVGLFCSTPGIAVARAVPQKLASYMLLTGMPIDAQEALRSGLVSRVVSDDKLQEETEKIVAAVLSKSYSVIALGKKFFYQQIQQNIQNAYRDGEQVMVANLSLKDAQEGISAFTTKRPPHWLHTDEKTS